MTLLKVQLSQCDLFPGLEEIGQVMRVGLYQGVFHLWLKHIQKIKSLIVSIVSPSICHKVMGPDARILVFEC